MANENGIIFIDASADPRLGICPADLRSVFHMSGNTVGWFVTHAPINKWSKYKPIKRGGLNFTEQLNADFTWKSNADWWKNTDGQCGLTFETAESLYTGNNPFASGSFFQKLKDGELAWGYERPTGGTSYPFRWRDFNYYNHNAPKPITGVYDNLRLYGGGKLTVLLDETRAEDDLGIQLSDLTIDRSPVGGWYVGVLIYKSDSQFTFAFSDGKIEDGEINVEFDNMTSYGGQPVTIVPFLSSVRDDQGVNPGAGIFLSCDVAPKNTVIRAETQGVVATTDAQWKDPLYVRVGYVLNIINNTGSQIVVTNLKIELYDGSQVVDRDTESSVTVPANEAKEVKGVLIADPYIPGAIYTVKVSSDRPEVNEEVQVEPYRG